MHQFIDMSLNFNVLTRPKRRHSLSFYTLSLQNLFRNIYETIRYCAKKNFKFFITYESKVIVQHKNPIMHKENVPLRLYDHRNGTDFQRESLIAYWR